MTDVNLAKRVDELEKFARRVMDERGINRCTNQKGAAAYMGRSREFIRLLVRHGRLQKNAVGQYDFADLDRLMDEGKAT